MALAFLVLAPVAGNAGPPPARFSIHASAVPVATGPSGSGLRLDARAAPVRAGMSGAGYRLSASVSASPMGCADDTIFVDGFDP